MKDAATITCPQCGASAHEDHRFCETCGSELPRLCASCSTPLTPGARFCHNCGHPVDAVGEAEARTGSGGTERRLVTVLFADLVGHTARTERQDPEETAAFLRSYFQRAGDVIGRFGGIVEKYIGDAVMAVWGAPIASEDDAERAVRAGLELQESIAKLSAEVGDPDVALRVGVLTGEAAVDAGSGNSTGMVVGDLVNSASRIQEAADAGTVVVGESTFRAASRAIAFEPVGKPFLKGKRNSIRLWRALRVIAERGGRGRIDGLEPPFVGRQDELQLLKDLLNGVGRDHRARLVSIVGDVGIGKSRLVWELQKYADGLADAIFWNQGRSASYATEGVAYRAASDMVRRRIGVSETDGVDSLAAALDASLETLVDETAERNRVRPWLAGLLGIEATPEGDRAELDAALRSFFGHMAELGPTVLVFEDLQWADSGLLDFVEHLPDWASTSPIFVVALSRPDLLERRPSFGTGRAGVVTMRLGPLSDAEMAELLEGMLGTLEETVLGSIIDRADGVPLFAVELARAVAGRMSREGMDDSTVRGELSAIAVPETLQSLIGSRIDRLPPADRTLLQDATILGHSFTVEGLAAITGLDETTLDRRIEDLVRRQLLEPVVDQRSPRHGGYRFVQDLVREVAAGRMSREIRRARHVAAAEYAEALGLPDQAIVAADHLLTALEYTPDGPEADALRTRAADVLITAFRRAGSLFAHEEVLSLGWKIVALDLDLPPETLANVEEQMSVAASALVRPDEAEEHALAAIELSRRAGDTAGVLRGAAAAAFVNLEAIRVDRAIRILDEHLADVHDLSAAPGLARLGGLRARAYFLRGDMALALDAAEKALVAAESLMLDGVVGDLLVTKATILGVEGRELEARLLLEGVIELARRRELNALALRAYINLGAVVPSSDVEGDPTSDAIELGRKIGNLNFTLFAMGNHIANLIARTRWEEAEVLLADPMWQLATGSLLVARHSLAAAFHAMRGNRAVARAEIEVARRETEDTDPQRAFSTGSAAAQVDLLTGERDAALAWVEQAMQATTTAWFDPLAIVFVLGGSARQVADLAHSSNPALQRSDRRVAPYLAALAAIASGDRAAVTRAAACTEAVGADGLLLLQAVMTVGLARFLPPGDERMAWLADARSLIGAHGLEGLGQFLDLDG